MIAWGGGCSHVCASKWESSLLVDLLRSRNFGRVGTDAFSSSSSVTSAARLTTSFAGKCIHVNTKTNHLNINTSIDKKINNNPFPC